jgi:hypothetical protein
VDSPPAFGGGAIHRLAIRPLGPGGPGDTPSLGPGGPEETPSLGPGGPGDTPSLGPGGLGDPMHQTPLTDPARSERQTLAGYARRGGSGGLGAARRTATGAACGNGSVTSFAPAERSVRAAGARPRGHGRPQSRPCDGPPTPWGAARIAHSAASATPGAPRASWRRTRAAPERSAAPQAVRHRRTERQPPRLRAHAGRSPARQRSASSGGREPSDVVGQGGGGARPAPRRAGAWSRRERPPAPARAAGARGRGGPGRGR